MARTRKRKPAKRRPARKRPARSRKRPARRRPARKPASRKRRPASKKRPARRPASRKRRRTRPAAGPDWGKLLLWGGGALALYYLLRPRLAGAATLPASSPTRLSEPRFFEIDGQCVDSNTNARVDKTVCTLCEGSTPGSFNWDHCYPGGK